MRKQALKREPSGAWDDESSKEATTGVPSESIEKPRKEASDMEKESLEELISPMAPPKPLPVVKPSFLRRLKKKNEDAKF